MKINIETSREARVGFGMAMEMAALLCEIRRRPQEAEAIRGMKKLMIRSAVAADRRARRAEGK